LLTERQTEGQTKRQALHNLHGGGNSVEHYMRIIELYLLLYDLGVWASLPSSTAD